MELYNTVYWARLDDTPPFQIHETGNAAYEISQCNYVKGKSSWGETVYVRGKSSLCETVYMKGVIRVHKLRQCMWRVRVHAVGRCVWEAMIHVNIESVSVRIIGFMYWVSVWEDSCIESVSGRIIGFMYWVSVRGDYKIHVSSRCLWGW